MKMIWALLEFCHYATHYLHFTFVVYAVFFKWLQRQQNKFLCVKTWKQIRFRKYWKLKQFFIFGIFLFHTYPKKTSIFCDFPVDSFRTHAKTIDCKGKHLPHFSEFYLVKILKTNQHFSTKSLSHYLMLRCQIKSQ